MAKSSKKKSSGKKSKAAEVEVTTNTTESDKDTEASKDETVKVDEVVTSKEDKALKTPEEDDSVEKDKLPKDEPVKEDKPPKEDPPPVKEVKKEKAQFTYKPADASIVNRINTYLEQFPKGDVVATAREFSMIFQQLVIKPSANNVAAVESFFRKHKDSMMAETVALQGLNSLKISVKQKIKVETLYHVFRTGTTKGLSSKTLNMEQVRKIVGDQLTTELVKKFKKK